MKLSSPTHMVGKYWTHEDDCGVPGQHVHYGQNVVLPVPNELGPLLSELCVENERLTRDRDAARMMIGPLSERADLVDACEDIVREMAHLKRVIGSKNELIDRLVTELGKIGQLRAAWAAVKESWWQGDSEQAVAYMELDTLLGVDADGNVVDKPNGAYV